MKHIWPILYIGAMITQAGAVDLVFGSHYGLEGFVLFVIPGLLALRLLWLDREANDRGTEACIEQKKGPHA